VARLLFTSRFFDSLADPLDRTAKEKLDQLLGKGTLFMKQSHSNQIQVVTDHSSTPEADGLVTNNKEIALAVRIADCMPVLMYSDHAVAAVHVGRKGLLNKVAINAVEAMKKFGPSPITAVVGPHICGNCYEVDNQMYKEIIKVHPATDGKVNYLNLFAGLKAQLPEVALTKLGLCTKENRDYFSYRSGDLTGRQVGVISL
jgi:YfiH family protein